MGRGPDESGQAPHVTEILGNAAHKSDVEGNNWFMSSIVSIGKTVDLTDAAIRQAVRRAVEDACQWGDLIPRGATVVIKPNVFMPAPPPTTTDPRVVVALIELAKEAGAGEVIVAEGRSISTAKYRAKHRTTRECFQVTGMAEAVKAAGAQLVPLEEGEYLEVEIPQAQVLKRAQVARTIWEAEVLINVPVMKVHSLTLVTLGIKNLHGIISDDSKLFAHNYRQLPQKLAELLLLKKPDLTALDALRGQEQDHAEQGIPVEVGAIIAGQDTVAVDAVASAVMGLDPLAVDTTRLAYQAGLGEANLGQIVVKGEPIERVKKQFALPDIELDPQRFPGLRVFAGDYCRACQYYVSRGLQWLAEHGLISESQPLAIVVGKDPQVPEEIPGRVIIIGDCALASESVKPLRDRLLMQDRLRFVYACPPMEFRIKAKELL